MDWYKFIIQYNRCINRAEKQKLIETINPKDLQFEGIEWAMFRTGRVLGFRYKDYFYYPSKNHLFVFYDRKYKDRKIYGDGTGDFVIITKNCLNPLKSNPQKLGVQNT